MTKPLPTREALIEALKQDRESFGYLSERLESNPDGPIHDCIDDSIARIGAILNYVEPDEDETTA